MIEQEFRSLVRDMRIAQRKYSNSRDHLDLLRAIDLERAVDDEVGGTKPPKQFSGGLFDR